MSWLISHALMEACANSPSSQALVAAFSEDTSSDGEQSVQSSGNPTQLAYLLPDRMTDFSRLSRFGMTFKPLTEDRGAALLTLYLEAFPAKTSALQAEETDSKESDQECGDTWRGSLAKFDPATSSWRTAQCSLLGEEHESLQTLPRSGTTANGRLWERQMSERRISETGSGLWPTPTVHGNYNHPGASKTSGMGLASAVRLWPTPVAQPANGTPARFLERKKEAVARGSAMGVCLSDLQLAAVASERGMQGRGQLNPAWVEWLMGWPLGWTDLKPLETDKFQQWQQQHGAY